VLDDAGRGWSARRPTTAGRRDRAHRYLTCWATVGRQRHHDHLGTPEHDVVLAVVATPDVVSLPAFMPAVMSPVGVGGLNRLTTRFLVSAGCSVLDVDHATPTVGPGVMLEAPTPAGDGRHAAVPPAGVADVAIDPSACLGRGDRRFRVSRRFTPGRSRHCAAFSRSISRKIA
jgi:hypothetical protein